MIATAQLPLLPRLHREIDDLDAVELIAVQRVIARLKMMRSLEKLNDLADSHSPRVSDAEISAWVTEVRRQRRASA